MKFVLGALACASMFLAPVALADDGDDAAFVLFNSSSVTAISFQTTRRDGSWSANWLSTPMKAGERRKLRFSDASDDRCTVKTRIQFSDGSKFETPVNYCKMSLVTATDTTLSTE